MLDKLKLFNKDKDRSKSSKRTSSSSGFSSARSDSSLSLNNDPSTSAISIAPSLKNKKNDAVNGTHKPSSNSTPMSSSKTSKIVANTKACLPAPAIKSQSKNDKKKAENNLEQLQSAAKFQQKVPNAKFQPTLPQQQQQQQIFQQQFLSQQQIDPRMKQQQPVFRKIEIRTEMKMPTPHAQAKVIIQPLTSIPKPMAAIKGTSKAQSKTNENFDGVKLDKSMIDSNLSLNGGEQKTQVVNPLSMSPQHNQLRSQNGLIHASLQSMTDSIHSASTNNHSNSSDSSVIYRPGTSESGSEFYHSNISSLQQQQQQLYRNPIPNRKVDHFNDALLTNGHKFNTIPTKLNGGTPTTVSSIGNNQMGPALLLEEQKKVSQHGTTVVPLRSIMRNYNNQQQQQQQQHVTTLPTRGARGGQNLVNGYYEEHYNQGYCSDGDALRKMPIRYSDIENGYLSEGGNGGVTNPHFMSIFRNRPQLPTTIAEER